MLVLFVLWGSSVDGFVLLVGIDGGMVCGFDVY